MLFEQLSIGGDRNFAYLIGDPESREAAVVDVGYNPQMVVDRLSDLELTLKYLIGTHDHYDHIDELPAVQQACGGKIVMHESVERCDIGLAHGDSLMVGPIEIRCIFCPGHTPDHICLLVGGTKLIAGDALFVGKIGGTSTPEQAQTQYDHLHSQLMTLDDSVEVYPGHDVGVRPSSTIGDERRTNPFLLRESFEDFLWLKENWAAYKAEHGIQ